MSEPVIPAMELLELLVKEARRRILALAAIFSAIAVGALAVGVLLPKEYETHGVLLTESRNMIAPLMAGRAVQAGAPEDAQILRQSFLSHRILREVLTLAEGARPRDPIEEVRAMNRLASRITILSPRRELIRISYRDRDPRRCLEVTNKLAELYIRESTSGKSRESRDAFEFIDRQVKEYAREAEEAHAKVLAYQRRVAARGVDSPVARRTQPSRGPRLPPEQLAALSVEEAALATELTSGEAHQMRQRRVERIGQLERELESLLTSYTENHPNVKRAREELRVQRIEAEKASSTDDAATATLRARLEQVRRRIAASSESVVQRAAPAAQELDPELRGVGQDAALSELVRRYEASRQVYQDLLVRRENARVSMELEAEQGNGSVRIYESPELPVIARGLRLLHVARIGLVLAVLAPIGLLLALLRLDPRVRSPRQFERLAHVPLLVGIPYAPTMRDRLRSRRQVLLAVAMIAVVFVTYATLFVVRGKLSS